MLVGAPGIGKTMLERALRRTLFVDSDADGFGLGRSYQAPARFLAHTLYGRFQTFALRGSIHRQSPSVTGTHVISGVDQRDMSEQDFGLSMTDRITKQVMACPRSIIAIDEVQFLKDNTLQELSDLWGYRQPVRTTAGQMVDFRKATFVMTSNDGSATIDQIASGSVLKKKEGAAVPSRSDMQYQDFVDTLKKRFTKREQWLGIKNRVDYFVPFLPMQSEQVEEAIEVRLKR